MDEKEKNKVKLGLIERSLKKSNVFNDLYYKETTIEYKKYGLYAHFGLVYYDDGGSRLRFLFKVYLGGNSYVGLDRNDSFSSELGTCEPSPYYRYFFSRKVNTFLYKHISVSNFKHAPNVMKYELFKYNITPILIWQLTNQRVEDQLKPTVLLYG